MNSFPDEPAPSSLTDVPAMLPVKEHNRFLEGTAYTVVDVLVDEFGWPRVLVWVDDRWASYRLPLDLAGWVFLTQAGIETCEDFLPALVEFFYLEDGRMGAEYVLPIAKEDLS